MALMMVGATAVDAAPKKKKKSDARYNDMHLVHVWGGAGYSGLVNGAESYNFHNTLFDPQFIGGGGGLLGVGYEYRFKKFMLTVGPEFRIFSSQDNFRFLDENGDPLALQGQRIEPMGLNYPMTQNYYFKNLHETQAVGQVMVPILFGANFDKYYFLAGGKVGFTVMNSWKTMGRLTTTITDNNAYEPDWGDIDSHYAVSGKVGEHPLMTAGKGNLSRGLDATLSAEFGVNLEKFFSEEWNAMNDAKDHPMHFRVGLFVDYGLMNLGLGKADQPLFALNPVNESVQGEVSGGMAQLSSLHASSWAPSHVNSLLVGIKGSFLLQLNKPKGHKPLVPQLQTQVKLHNFDEEYTMSGVTVLVQNEEVNPKTGLYRAKPKRFTTGKNGTFDKPKPVIAGTYTIWVDTLWSQRNGYFHSDSVTGYAMVEPEQPKTKKDKIVPQQIALNVHKIPVWHVTVKDQQTQQPMEVELRLKSVTAGLLDTVLHTTSTGETEFVFGKLDYLHKTYTVELKAEGYFTQTQELSGSAIGQHSEYWMEPVPVVKRTFILKNMFFATNKTDILPQSETDLQTLYEFLSENPNARIRIVGHTDSVGSDESNMRLSQGRSASVKNEMVKRGIDANRIETDGKGESEPIDTNDTEEGRQNNRRVEVQVLSE